MGPMAEPPEFLIKILFGFVTLMVFGVIMLLLSQWEQTWFIFAGVAASWAVGHLLFKAEEWLDQNGRHQ